MLYNEIIGFFLVLCLQTFYQHSTLNDLNFSNFSLFVQKYYFFFSKYCDRLKKTLTVEKRVFLFCKSKTYYSIHADKLIVKRHNSEDKVLIQQIIIFRKSFKRKGIKEEFRVERNVKMFETAFIIG